MSRTGDWLRRKVRDPLRAELVKGVSPEGLALAGAVGLFLCVSPFLGTTTVLCFLAGWLLRLNHVILQTINVFAAPLQLLLILPFMRLGERLTAADPADLHIGAMVAAFGEDPGQAFHEYGQAGLHGLLGWIVAAPFIILPVYWIFRGIFRRAVRRLQPLP